MYPAFVPLIDRLLRRTLVRSENNWAKTNISLSLKACSFPQYTSL